MAISSILSAAVSGLANASLRVAVSADNLANVNTPGFRAKEVRSSTIVTRPATGSGFAAGGITGVLRTTTGPTLVNGSNVDVAAEFINLTMATLAYKANLQVIATGQELAREVIDIKA